MTTAPAGGRRAPKEITRSRVPRPPAPAVAHHNSIGSSLVVQKPDRHCLQHCPDPFLLLLPRRQEEPSALRLPAWDAERRRTAAVGVCRRCVVHSVAPSVANPLEGCPRSAPEGLRPPQKTSQHVGRQQQATGCGAPRELVVGSRARIDGFRFSYLPVVGGRGHGVADRLGEALRGVLDVPLERVPRRGDSLNRVLGENAHFVISVAMRRGCGMRKRGNHRAPRQPRGFGSAPRSARRAPTTRRRRLPRR